ncbi:MAG: hypothetical protein VW547_11570 [Alphaproteobacteria bacterium]
MSRRDRPARAHDTRAEPSAPLATAPRSISFVAPPGAETVTAHGRDTLTGAPSVEAIVVPPEPLDTYEHATIGGVKVPPVPGTPPVAGRPLGPITFTFNGSPVPLSAVTPPSGAVWNGIRRAWLVPGPDGALVVADPQPPPPLRSFTTGAPAADVPPSVKISA